jgi:hypothetical protein
MLLATDGIGDRREGSSDDGRVESGSKRHHTYGKEDKPKAPAVLYFGVDGSDLPRAGSSFFFPTSLLGFCLSLLPIGEDAGWSEATTGCALLGLAMMLLVATGVCARSKEDMRASDEFWTGRLVLTCKAMIEG